MEIPGYRVLRELGAGGSGRVYQASERRSNRPLALKVVEFDPAADELWRDRAMRRARRVGRLHHRHIVPVYAVGLHDAGLHVAMEYLPGGDLHARLRVGVSLPAVLDITEQIAGALDHAHAHGCVHRDVTPANILFREDGDAVLVDFVGGPLSDPSLGPKHGPVRTVGTPGYMSPEQAAGREPDGRSDFYSLGIVFFQMLTGDTPHPFDRQGGTVVRHPAASIPQLPETFAAFQDIVDRFLAPDPERRFQGGAEIARALETVRFEDVTPYPAVNRALVSTGEIAVLAASSDAWRDAARSGRDDRSRARVRVAPIAVSFALALVVVGGGYYGVTQPDAAVGLLALTGLTEHPQVEEAWSAAEALRSDPNQSLAAIVAAYRRVLDQAPLHEEALAALSTVAAAWKNDIAQAIESEDFALADAKLRESLNIFPRDSELTVLFERVSDRRRADSILRGARVLLATQSMSDEPAAAAAIQAYQEVLRRNPGNEEALASLDELAGHYTALAEDAVTEGDVSGAMNKLGRASSANPDYVQLPRVRALISQAATLQSEIEEMLQRAADFRVAAALVDPVQANAAEIYFRVLATDPDNAIAHQGLSEVAAQVLVQFSGLVEVGDLAAAQHLLDRSVAVGLGEVTVNEMHARYDAEVQRLDTVATLLAAAEALFQDGYFTEPVEANVVAKLREAIRLDPANARASTLLTRTAERLAEVAQEAFAVGLASDARYYLDLALTVTPDVDAWRGLRDAWSDGIAASEDVAEDTTNAPAAGDAEETSEDTAVGTAAGSAPGTPAGNPAGDPREFSAGASPGALSVVEPEEL